MAMKTLPWVDLYPLLNRWVDDGASWQAMADTLTDRYKMPVAATTVRNQWLRAQEGDDGYVIPVARPPRRSPTTDPDTFAAAVAWLNTKMGRGKTDPISISEYDTMRDDYTGTRGAPVLPSSVSMRRRYGTWSAACTAAGVDTHEARRDYDGLTRDDGVLWLAHWLRYLRHEPGLPTATSAAYRTWVRHNREAPSWDSLRNLGSWSGLLADAETLERGTARLKKPKPVASGPGKKKFTPLPMR